MKQLPKVLPFSFIKQQGRWKFKLTSELWIEFPNIDFGRADFYDDNGVHRCQSRGNLWGIHRDYAWDGSSCVPDFDSTIAASCWHDSTGQFRHTKCLKKYLTGRMWNAGFADIITAQGSPWIARTYWLGLTLFNPGYQLAGKLFGSKADGTCKPA